MEAQQLAETIDQAERALYVRNEALRVAASAGYRQNDLEDAGVSVRLAKTVLTSQEASTQIVKTGTIASDPMKPQPEDVVSVVAADSEDGARELLSALSAYCRLESLRLPVPMASSWLAVTDSKEIRRLYPVTLRAYVPSAIAPFGPGFTTAEHASLTALLASHEYREIWGDDPTAVFLVGAPFNLPRAIPLGYAKGGVAGTRTYVYEELEAATELNGTLTWRAVPKLTLKMVQDAINVLPPGKVTSYREIGKAYGRPNAAQAVSKIVGRVEIMPEEAARVIGTTHKVGKTFRMVDAEFASHHGVKLRSEALAKANVDCDPKGRYVFVRENLWVKSEELQQLLGLRQPRRP